MWVHTDPNYEAVAKADAAAYEAATGVKINLSYVPWDEYGAKIVAAFASGSQPDIIQGVASWLYPQKTGGQLSEVPSDFAATLADTAPASLPPVEYNGKYYGVPLNVNIDAGPFIIYNVDEFAAASVTPKWSTWDSFVGDLQKVTVTQGGTITRSGIEMTGSDPVTQFLLYFLRSGGTFYSTDHKSVQIANQYGQNALQIMQDLISKDHVDSTSLTDYEGIASGTAASIIYGPWYTAVLKHDFPDFKWGWAQIPPSPGQVTEAFPGTNVWAWMVPSSSRNATAAWDYIRWLSKPEQRVAWSLATGEIPAVQSLWTDSQIANDVRWAPWFPYLKDQVPVLYVGPQDPQYKDLTDMAMSVLLGKSTIPQALQTAQDQLDAILAAS
jgi:multiple sugar transport system substrate-binding protein